MTEPTDYFVLAQSSLVYSVDELDRSDVENFLRFIRAKKNAGWTPAMIETHLVANMSVKIKNQYSRLRTPERIAIAEEMIQAIIERILRDKIDVQ